MDTIQNKYAAGLVGLNATQFASAWSPDGTSEDPVGSPEARGREAIAAGIQALLDLVTRVAVPVYNGPLCDVDGKSDSGAANWIIQFFGKNKCTAVANGIDVFKFNADGSIAALYSWWDGPTAMAMLDPKKPCTATDSH